MPLFEKTIDLLRNRPRHMTLQFLSKETDLKMSWLVKMAGSSPPQDPGVNMVEKLYSYLAGQELELVNHDTTRTKGS